MIFVKHIFELFERYEIQTTGNHSSLPFRAVDFGSGMVCLVRTRACTAPKPVGLPAKGNNLQFQEWSLNHVTRISSTKDEDFNGQDHLKASYSFMVTNPLADPQLI